MSRHSIVAVAFAVFSFSSIVACGSSDEGSSTATSAVVSAKQAESFCSSYCGRSAECDSSIDVDTCATECEDVTSSSFRRLRADVIEPTRECFVNSDCRSILTSKRLGACIEESAAMVAPSPAAKAFCDAFVTEAGRCDAHVDRADCLSVARIFGDEALANAKACTAKSCSVMGPCVEAELSLE